MKKRNKVLIFLILFMGMIIFPYIPLELFNIDYNNISQTNKIIYNFICDMIYALIIFLFYYRRNIDELKDYVRNFKKYFIMGTKYYIVGFIVMYLSNILIASYFSQAMPNNDVAVKNMISLYPWYMFFSTVIYAPFVEESIFRRSIRDIFGNKKNRFVKYGYIMVSGLLFAGMHIIGAVNSVYDWLYIIPYSGLGIAFAALYYDTDNIYTTIGLHFVHNLIAVLLYIGMGV